MHVYARIWLHWSSISTWLEQYVSVFPAYTCRYWHLAGDTVCTYMHVYARIYVSILAQIRAHTYCQLLSRLLCVHRRRGRSLHFRPASLSRGSASAGRSPNLIRSGLRDQSARSRRRQLGQARLGCAMAILVTTEQRSPGDGAMIRYICWFQFRNARLISNRHPLLRHWFWDFSNHLHTEIQAQIINANVNYVT